MRAFFSRKVTISFGRSMWIVLCFSAATAYAVIRLAPIEVYILKWLVSKSHFAMPLVNFLPIYACMLLLFLITNNIGVSCGAVSYVAVLMASVNRIKLLLRGDPLFHWDFALVSEALTISEGVNASYIPLLIGCTAAFIALFAFIAVKLKSSRKAPLKRVLQGLVCGLCMALLNATLYSSKAVNDWLPVYGSFYNLADVHNSRGSLYSFLYNMNLHRLSRPDDYAPEAVAAAIEAYTFDDGAESADRPHIIMIMGEAFSDLSASGAFDFSAYGDPLEAFNRLSEESIRGSLVVPSRGGGTADTEFDVLTGRPSRLFRAAPYAYRLVVRPVEALPSLLSREGYAAIALHPGFRWFYNRQNAYRYIGFDDAVFEDAFPREAYMDTYISEEATFDKLIEMIDAHIGENPGVPLFSFCVTIQNHGGYYDRYLAEGTVNFDSAVALTEQETNILSNYFAGVADADAQLGRLTDYLETLSEPVLLVYFGDHLPSFSMALYNRVIPGADAEDGSFEQETRLYRVPFLVWQNQTAKETTQISARAQALFMPEDRTISSNYLGAYVLELIGMGRASPYFAYANEMRAKYPVVMETFSFSAGGVADTQALSLFRDWAYYRMKNE